MAGSLPVTYKRVLKINTIPKDSETKAESTSFSSPRRQSKPAPAEPQIIAKSNVSIQLSTRSSSLSSLARTARKWTGKKRTVKAKITTNDASKQPKNDQSQNDEPGTAVKATPSRNILISPTEIQSEGLYGLPNRETAIIQPSGPEHTHTFIFLHGRDEDGSSIANSFLTNNNSHTNNTLANTFSTMRFVFPTARLASSVKRPENINHDTSAEVRQERANVPQWLDIPDPEKPIAEEEKKIMLPRLRATICDIAEIILMEASTVGMEKIILGGSGPGAAMALLTLLVIGQDIGAFVGWGGWLPFQTSIKSIAEECFDDRLKISRRLEDILGMDGAEEEELGEVEADNDEGYSTDSVLSMFAKEKRKEPVAMTPILLGHAEDDKVVPYGSGRDMSRTLNSLGFQGNWHKCTRDCGNDEGLCVDPIADFFETMLTIEGRNSVWYDDQADELETSGLPTNPEDMPKKYRKAIAERQQAREADERKRLKVARKNERKGHIQ